MANSPSQMRMSSNSEAPAELPVDYILEPDPLSLVRSLLPKVLRLKIYTVMLDASAAEHAARTIAMQVASDNAQNLIAELTLVYNKTFALVEHGRMCCVNSITSVNSARCNNTDGRFLFLHCTNLNG